MSYRLKLIKKAEKDLDRIKDQEFEVIKHKISALSENPRPHGCQKLTGEEGYRIRSGDFRVLYRIDDSRKEVIIYRVKHRKDVYR